MRKVLLFSILIVANAFAQSGGIAIELGSDTIRIGEQTTLRLIVGDATSSVDWPLIQDTLTTHVEVIQDNGVDTVANDPSAPDGHLILVRELVITSFDTGYWAIPPFKLSVNGKALETSPLLIFVRGVAVGDAASLHDIHDVSDVPFHLGYWLLEHWKWFVIAGVIIVLVLIVIYILKNKKPAEAITPVAIEVAIHERYLQELRALDGKRLWQQGSHKEYQSSLTDLLRGYIEERYSIPALERTTDELIHELKVSPLDRDQQNQLANVLRLADMVKFAKALPAPAENEQMMTEAIRFIQQTAPLPNKQSRTPHAK